MKTDSIETKIKSAFESFADIDLLPEQKSGILRRAELINARKTKARAYRRFAWGCAFGAAACIVFTLLLRPSDKKYTVPDNNFGSIDMEVSGGKRLVMKDGELQIISDYEHKWDISIEATLAAMRAAKYFYGEDELLIVHHFPYNAPLLRRHDYGEGNSNKDRLPPR